MSNIDDIFKKGLDGKGMEYSDASWAGMEQMLDTKQIGFFARYKLLLGFGSLLLIGSIALLCYKSLSPDTTVNTPTVLAEMPSETTTVKEEMAMNNRGIMISENPTSTNHANIPSEIPFIHNEQREISAIQRDVVSTDGNQDSKQISKTVSSSTNNKKFLDSQDFSFNAASTGKENSVMTSNPNLINFGKDQSLRNIQVAAVAITPNINDFNSTLKTTETQDFEQLVDLKSKIVTVFPYEVGASGLNTLASLPNPKAKNISLYISPYVGYINYFKNAVVPKTTYDRENNLGKSNAEASYNYGLNIGFKRGKWMLSSGIGMLHLKEKTYYTETNDAYTYVTAPRISNSAYTTTPRGTRVALITQENIDSTLVSTTDQVCEGCDVSFNYISVPLNLQYNFGKDRLRYFVEAGLSASFLQKAKGNYAIPAIIPNDSVFLPNTPIVSLANGEEVSKMLLQANAAIGVKFWLSPKWNLWTSYGYGMGLNSMLSIYEQKPTIQNLRVGVEFKLR